MVSWWATLAWSESNRSTRRAGAGRARDLAWRRPQAAGRQHDDHHDVEGMAAPRRPRTAAVPIDSAGAERLQRPAWRLAWPAACSTTTTTTATTRAITRDDDNEGGYRCNPLYRSPSG